MPEKFLTSGGIHIGNFRWIPKEVVWRISKEIAGDVHKGIAAAIYKLIRWGIAEESFGGISNVINSKR